MNGSVAFFPVNDGSAIFAKSWNRDGSIATVVYKPVMDEQQDQQPQVTLMDVMDQLSNIEDLLKLEKKPAPKRTTAKKEAADDTSE